MFRTQRIGSDLIGRVIGRPGLLLVSALGLLVAAAPARAGVINITPFNLPGTARTTIEDVNNAGQIVGDFQPAPGQFVQPYIHDLGTGTTTTFTVPDATNARAVGINDSGQVVGLYRSATDDLVRGFLFDGSTVSIIEVPGSPYTFPIRIRNDGLIVGRFEGTDGITRGFSDDGSGFTPYEVAGSPFTEINSITSSGTFIGGYEDAAGNFFGFIDDGSTFTTLEAPGSVGYTDAYDINEHGLIIGSFEDGLDRLLGFALFDGSYHSFGVENPAGGLFDTFALGVNDTGMIVGYYFDEDGIRRGFTAQFVPEPSSLVMAAFGVVAVVGAGLVRNRRRSVEEKGRGPSR